MLSSFPSKFAKNTFVTRLNISQIENKTKQTNTHKLWPTASKCFFQKVSPILEEQPVEPLQDLQPLTASSLPSPSALLSTSSDFLFFFSEIPCCWMAAEQMLQNYVLNLSLVPGKTQYSGAWLGQNYFFMAFGYSLNTYSPGIIIPFQ